MNAWIRGAAAALAILMGVVSASAKEPPTVTNVKAVVDPGTGQVFTVLGGKMYKCRSCLPLAVKQISGPTHVLWPRGSFKNLHKIRGRWVRCASEIIRAYEREVGGDPDEISMPASEFLRRQERMMRSNYKRCGDTSPAF